MEVQCFWNSESGHAGLGHCPELSDLEQSSYGQNDFVLQVVSDPPTSEANLFLLTSRKPGESRLLQEARCRRSHQLQRARFCPSR